MEKKLHQKGSQFEMKRLTNNADILLFYGKTERALF